MRRVLKFLAVVTGLAALGGVARKLVTRRSTSVEEIPVSQDMPRAVPPIDESTPPESTDTGTNEPDQADQAEPTEQTDNEPPVSKKQSPRAPTRKSATKSQSPRKAPGTKKASSKSVKNKPEQPPET